MHKSNLQSSHTTPSVRLHFEGGKNTHCVQQSYYECGPERLSHTCACQYGANSCLLCHVTAWSWNTQTLSHGSSAKPAPQSLWGRRLSRTTGLCSHNGQWPPALPLPTQPYPTTSAPSRQHQVKRYGSCLPPTPWSQSRPSHREPRAGGETLDANMWTQQELETRHRYISPHLSGYLSLSRSQRRS